jgi:hypothetical protein
MVKKKPKVFSGFLPPEEVFLPLGKIPSPK